MAERQLSNDEVIRKMRNEYQWVIDRDGSVELYMPYCTRCHSLLLDHNHWVCPYCNGEVEEWNLWIGSEEDDYDWWRA